MDYIEIFEMAQINLKIRDKYETIIWITLSPSNVLDFRQQETPVEPSVAWFL